MASVFLKFVLRKNQFFEAIFSFPFLVSRVRNEKIDINETNWTPNQYTEYLNLYIKTAKRAAPIP